MAKPISVTHDDIEIVYRESDNRWVFTLRGRERSAESLTLAKAAIDKPEPKKKAVSDFVQFEAWYGGRYRGTDWKKVTVTSIAEERIRVSDSGDVWIRDGKERSKVEANEVFPVGEKNDAIVGEILDLKKAKESVEKKIVAARRKLKVFVIPKDQEESGATP